MNLWESLKERFWRSPFLSEEAKVNLYFNIRTLVRGKKKRSTQDSTFKVYARQVLNGQTLDNRFSTDFPTKPVVSLDSHDPKLVAYYLPQYYPDSHNDRWWGKGSTEWTNTTKAVAQYLGQYQPRLPGELGFYDLRIKENLYRQIELAKIHGIYGFCFYYYWFSGERILEFPLKAFVEDEKINFPFFICWANDSWTKSWSSSSVEILLELKHTVENYKAFIHSCLPLFSKKNYMRIKGRPILNVFHTYLFSDWKPVIAYWRKVVREELGCDLYVIGSLTKESEYKENYLAKGFDAVNEFSFIANLPLMNDITQEKTYVCDTFLGKVYDYKEFVEAKKYFRNTARKLYRAVAVGFDNTARKKNKGSIILDGACPELYGKWLTDTIVSTSRNDELDDKMIFLFAWNEWAEGAYLEPDLKFKYGYLEETAKAIESARAILRNAL